MLVSGVFVARTGDVLAAQTGLGSSIVGATLVALATSLPEVSTTATAVRLGAYGMAVSNILGTNALEVALFFVADLFYRHGLVFMAMKMCHEILRGQEQVSEVIATALPDPQQLNQPFACWTPDRLETYFN